MKQQKNTQVSTALSHLPDSRATALALSKKKKKGKRTRKHYIKKKEKGKIKIRSTQLGEVLLRLPVAISHNQILLREVSENKGKTEHRFIDICIDICSRIYVYIFICKFLCSTHRIILALLLLIYKCNMYIYIYIHICKNTYVHM